MSMKWIREHYSVPAKRGMQVVALGKKGVITQSSNGYLRVRLDGEKRSFYYHPTWHIEYLNGDKK